MLALEEMEKQLQLILEVAQFEQGSGVVPVVAFCASAFFAVAGADGAFFLFHRGVVKCFVAEPFCAEYFEGVCEFFVLSISKRYY